LAVIFSGVLFALSYASYVSNQFNDLNFNPRLFASFVPAAIALLGVVVSILVLLVVYAFSSLRERTVTYASEVTKGLRQAKAKDEAMLLSIGEGLVVAAQAAVMKSVPAGITVTGSPARDQKEYLKAQASLNLLPKYIETIKELKKKIEKLEEKIGNA
jgi:hypothetical protein